MTDQAPIAGESSIVITGPRMVATVANGRVYLTVPDPTDMVSRTITVPSQTLLMFCQRIANVQQYQPTVPDPANEGQTIPNPTDCAKPALAQTLGYWIGEAEIETRQMASEIHAAEVVATQQSLMGDLSTITVD